MPIGFGVLTTDTIEQAIERAGTQGGQQGRRRRARRDRNGEPAAPAGRLRNDRDLAATVPDERAACRARLVLQALYQWQMTGQSFAELRNQYTADEGYAEVDPEYFQQLLQGVIDDSAALDAMIGASGSIGRWSSSTRSSTRCC